MIETLKRVVAGLVLALMVVFAGVVMQGPAVAGYCPGHTYKAYPYKFVHLGWFRAHGAQYEAFDKKRINPYTGNYLHVRDVAHLCYYFDKADAR